MLYRVLNQLDAGKRIINRGDFVTTVAFSPDALQRLIAVGALAELHAPPLDELPGLEQAAEQLNLIGIFNADQLLEGDIDVIAGQVETTCDRVQQWRQIARGWLIIDEPPHG